MAVAWGVGARVGVKVADGVGVCAGVAVGAGVLVAVGVGVGVCVGAAVGAGVCVAVGVGVCVGVKVAVGAGVCVAVGVGVCVGAGESALVGASALTKTGGVGVWVGGETAAMRGGCGGRSSPDWDAMMMSVTIAKNAAATPAATSADGRRARLVSGLGGTGGRETPAPVAPGAAMPSMAASAFASSPGV